MAKMKIRVLGSGSSGNCYAIEQGDRFLLLDAGVDIRKIMEAVDYSPCKISAVLLTHEHKDHSKSVPELLRRGVSVYMTQGTADALGVSGNHYCHVVEYDTMFSFPYHAARAVRMAHDASEPAGYLIARNTSSGPLRIVYATDTAYLDVMFPGVTHMIVECNYSGERISDNESRVPEEVRRRIAQNHMSVENLAEYLDRADKSSLRMLMLAHISAERNDGNAAMRVLSSHVPDAHVCIAIPGKEVCV